MTKFRRGSLVAIALALPLGLAACGSSSTNASGSSSTMSSAATSSSSPSSAMSSTAMADMPFGPGCAAVPTTGAGSFSGMATAQVATAASANPLLSQLVGAVKAAGLVETLNSSKDITVFAPTNDAFAAVPKATLDAALKDPKGLLTKVLTNHVVAGRLAPDQLAGSHKTLAGTTIDVTGSGTDFTVGKAKVICGNVMTANATVYIIDQVLLPTS
ncbi:MAG: fasciclin domain-containing protein [Nostocoides sp.]